MPFVLIISLAGCIIGRNGQLERLVIGARILAKGSDESAFGCVCSTWGSRGSGIKLCPLDLTSDTLRYLRIPPLLNCMTRLLSRLSKTTAVTLGIIPLKFSKKCYNKGY